MKQCFWLAIHFLRYQWRERLLLTLSLAILMGVTMLSAVNFFASSTQQAMDERSSALLGADWLVESTVPLPIDDWSVLASDLGLESAETIEFLSMAAFGDKLQLASIKAVDEAYPLRGFLEIRDANGDQAVNFVPQVGEVWLAPRLLQALNVSVGDKIEIGAAKLLVRHIIAHEPDTGLAFLAMAPRILMNVADLPVTKVIDLGSRVQYRFLVSGDHTHIAMLAQEIQPELSVQQKVTDNMNARPEVVQPIDQLLHFLTITAMIIFVLAALAMALATRTYAQKQTDSTAILRCLGATKRDMCIVYLSSLLVLTLITSLIACALGFGMTQGLIHLAYIWWEVELPPPAIYHTLWVSVATGVALVLGFAWPWLLNLQNVSPLRVLQRQLPPPALSMYGLYGTMVIAFVFIWSMYQTPILSISMVVSIAVLLGGFAIATVFLLRFVAYLGRHLRMPWRLGLLHITQDKRSGLMQLWVYTFVLTLVFFFVLVRQDFIKAWENKFPLDAPNYFVINILPDQVTPLEQFFAAQQQTVPVFYPMVRARLTKKNDHTVSLDDYPAGDAPNMIRRDLNLSFSDHLDNKTIVAGDGWDLSAYDRALISVEARMSEELGLKLGDSLTFQAGVNTFTGQIDNIREVDWYTMQPNFYVITTPGLLIDYPRTYLGSFYVAAKDEDKLNLLISQFPNLSLIDVDDIINSTRDLITQALRVIEVLFFMVCLAALLVLVVIQRTQAESRAFTCAVLRTLGASKAQLVRGFLSEFALIGLLSGFIAVLLAQALSAWMVMEFFSLPWHFNGLMLIGAPLIGLCIYLVLGVLTMRGLLRTVPILRLNQE